MYWSIREKLFVFQLVVFLSIQTIDKMASLYKSPEEIDLYLAGMSEKVDSSSGILGHTFLHMVADQFARLKEADRYFYETGDQSGSFTIGLLSAVFIAGAVFYTSISRSTERNPQVVSGHDFLSQLGRDQEYSTSHVPTTFRHVSGCTIWA